MGAAVGPLVFKALSWLGIGFVTYQVLSVIIDNIESEIATYIGQIPADLYQILAYGGVITGLKIVLSALSVRAVLAASQTFMTKK